MTKKKPPGTPHGNKGKVRSAETRAKLSVVSRQRWSDPEFKARSGVLNKRGPMSDAHKEKIRVAVSGKKRRPFTEEHKQKLREAKLGKPGPWAGIKRGPHSAEWRANISKGNYGRPAYYPMRRFYYKDKPFRSGWERFVAMAFDKKGIKWEFEPCKFDLGSQTYTPDFYLPELDCYWEVKGYFGPKSQATVALFREKYPEVSLIVATEDTIRLLDTSFNLRDRS